MLVECDTGLGRSGVCPGQRDGPGGFRRPRRRAEVDGRVGPHHACVVSNPFDEFVIARGDEVVDRWLAARGKSA